MARYVHRLRLGTPVTLTYPLGMKETFQNRWLKRVGWAFMHGVAILYLDGQVPIADLDAMVDEAIDVLLEGIAV